MPDTTVSAAASLAARGRFTAALGGFGPLGILAVMVILAGNPPLFRP